MRTIQDRLFDRLPAAMRGRRARFIQPVLRLAGRVSGLDRIDGFLQRSRHLHGLDFVAAALDFLQAGYELDDAALARIPRSGGVLVVANHPSGALDALALLDAMGRVRGDVRIVANRWLEELDGLRPLLLPVPVIGARVGPRAVEGIASALNAGHCVIAFPAGEVSRLGWQGVRDGRWKRGVLALARRAGIPVLPVRVQARNSAFFYGASAVFKPLGTALLAREMLARRRRRLELHVGHARLLDDATDIADALRREVHALGRARAAECDDARGPLPVIDPVDPARVRAGIEAFELLGTTRDGRQLRVGRLAAGAPLLQELGRLRELSFRSVGEGTGQRLDVDLYDTWYDHIVLWDDAAGRIAGAYRVARGAQVLAKRGIAGFYTASLFDFGEAAVARIASGMELGRSFVATDYLGGRSLDMLWQGIGAYLARHPDVRYLFGPVSISAALPAPAREQIVAYYARFHGQDGRAVARRPFAYRAAPPEFGTLDATLAFDVLRTNLGALGARIPMLYRQYLELCEPGGARFLAFGVDPAFSDAVDGLVEVDLACMRREKRLRYFGAGACA